MFWTYNISSTFFHEKCDEIIAYLEPNPPLNTYQRKTGCDQDC